MPNNYTNNIILPIGIKQYINYIKDWFNINLGFKPTNPQIIEFCVNTTMWYNDSNDGKFKGVTSIPGDVFYVSINSKTRKTLRQFADKYKKSIGLNMPMLLSSLIVYRYLTLPIKPVSKPLDYRSKSNMNRNKQTLLNLSYFK